MGAPMGRRAVSIGVTGMQPESRRAMIREGEEGFGEGNAS